MVRISYVRKDQGTKNPRLSAIIAGGGSITFTLSGMTPDQIDDSREYLGKKMSGKTFNSREEAENLGWQELIKYKERNNIPLSQFEFNQTIPDTIVKFSGLAIKKGRSSNLMFYSNALLGTEKHSIQLSLGIQNLSEENKKILLDQLEGFMRTTRVTTIESARREVAKGMADIMFDMGLITENLYGALISGDKRRFLSAVLAEKSRGAQGR